MSNVKAYQNFFLKSEDGQEFVRRISSLILENHEKAEREPEHARDYSQRASGQREVIDLIRSLTTEIKKGKRM